MPGDSNATANPEFRAAGSMTSAMLLAFTGGAIDAFVYLNHGHVFAAAQTGNGVLFGVAILNHDTAQAVRRLVPIVAFILGALSAKALASLLKRHAARVGLLCEITILFAASWLPGSFPDMAFIALIAAVTAYQITSFRTADVYSYNSTFLTSNLREAVEGLYDTFHPATRDAGLHKFRAFALLVPSFMAGALAGALLSPRFFNHTLWFIDIPLVAVLLHVHLQCQKHEGKA